MKEGLLYLIFLLLFAFPLHSSAQLLGGQLPDIEDDDLNIGGDIFNDFNEDVDASKIVEDERFYRYGRFFSFNIALGITSFSGNRGIAYEDDPPTYGFNLQYFFDFNSSFGMGFEFSKHHFYIEQAVVSYNPNPPGLIEVKMLRAFFGYRYYIDTANLGTAITYANPYLTGRIEYWYSTNKFIDQSGLGNDSGGGLGFGAGGGLEFPIKMRESYIGVEILFHTVNFHDKYTHDYQPIEDGGYGYDDFTGNVYTALVSYVISW